MIDFQSNQTASRPYNHVPTKGHLDIDKEAKPPDPRTVSAQLQTDFDDFGDRLLDHVLTEKELASILEGEMRVGSRYRYSDPRLLDAIKSGLLRVDHQEVCDAFLEWWNQASVTVLQDMRSGERLARLAPKRGNIAFARDRAKRSKELLESMDGLQFDFPIEGFRPELTRATFLLFLTLTDDVEGLTRQEAWASVSYDFKKFKISLARAMGHDEIFHDSLGRKRKRRVKASVNVIRAFEANENGYPAPHCFVLLDRPVRAFRHQKVDKRGKARHSWRLDNEHIRSAIKESWKSGFVDIQAVVSDSKSSVNGSKGGLEYLDKYMSKSYDLNSASEGKEDAGKHKRIALATHAYAKLLNLRTVHVGQSFKLRTNPRRLDSRDSQSQQGIIAVWRYAGSVDSTIDTYCSDISKLHLQWASETPFSLRKRGLPPVGQAG